jgi:glycosyltransferase involved in cell wall biosynthesis
VVDDGSTDNTKTIVENLTKEIGNLTLLTQNHLGPGAARNMAARKATGEILVFVDADMEFDPEFLKLLTAPIKTGNVIGTFSTDEKLLNTNDPWAVCWNLNFSGNKESLTKDDNETQSLNVYLRLKKYLETIESRIAPIAHNKISDFAGSNNHLPFRAISKKAFLSVDGFTTGVGYTDDWTLAEKLKTLPVPVKATYYHKNPATLGEIYRQAKWIGRGALMRGNIVRVMHSLLLHNLVTAFIIGIIKSIRFRMPRFLIFKLVYSLGIFVSVLESLFSKNTAR